MTKHQLSLIRQASRDHADGGTKWPKRMERWLDLIDPLPSFIRIKWGKLKPGQHIDPKHSFQMRRIL